MPSRRLQLLKIIGHCIIEYRFPLVRGLYFPAEFLQVPITLAKTLFLKVRNGPNIYIPKYFCLSRDQVINSTIYK